MEEGHPDWCDAAGAPKDFRKLRASGVHEDSTIVSGRKILRLIRTWLGAEVVRGRDLVEQRGVSA